MMLCRAEFNFCLISCVLLSHANAAHAQALLDHIDPLIAARAAERAGSSASGSGQPVQTETSTSYASVDAKPILVNAVRVEGAPDLPAPLLIQATSSFIGRKLTRPRLEELLGAVSRVARAQGYLFARSTIPPQAIVAGILRVLLDEGRIDLVETPGDKSGVVRSILSPLIGRPARQVNVERQLTLAGDLPGISVGRVRYELRGTLGVLIVPVTRHRVTVRALIDNRGLATLGPERAQVSVDINGVFNERDSFTSQGLITPFNTGELVVGFWRYSSMLSNSGTELALYATYAHTHLSGAKISADSTGTSGNVGISLTQPLARGRRVSIWLAGELDTFALNQSYDGSLARRDRLTTAAVSINGYAPFAGGRLRAGAGVTQGIDVLGATNAGDPLASRSNAGGVFTLSSIWANWTGDIKGPLSARLALAGQLSNKPLLAVEQITIGGPVFGRSYDYSERAGDGGVLASAELRAKLVASGVGLLRGAQLFIFGDIGHVANRGDKAGTGTLSSAGVGTRVTLSNRIELQLEAAVPLNADYYAPTTRSPRVFFSVSKTF